MRSTSSARCSSSSPRRAPRWESLPTLRAATDPDVDGGDYYGPDGFQEFKGHPEKVDMSKRAKDDDLADQLWDVSIELSQVAYLT